MRRWSDVLPPAQVRLVERHERCVLAARMSELGFGVAEIAARIGRGEDQTKIAILAGRRMIRGGSPEVDVIFDGKVEVRHRGGKAPLNSDRNAKRYLAELCQLFAEPEDWAGDGRGPRKSDKGDLKSEETDG